MSIQNGLTFPNTAAATAGRTVSGMLWTLKEDNFAPIKRECWNILTDLQSMAKGSYTSSTIAELLRICREKLTLLDQAVDAIIQSVEEEEENAHSPNLPIQQAESGNPQEPLF